MNSYISADFLVQLTDKDIHVNWLKFAPSRDLTNKAFKIYYDAFNRAKKTKGALAANMITDLRSAAHEGMGWGTYSGDLTTVFQTLWANSKQWRENYSENYNGPQVTGAYQVPVGVCNFLKAVDWRAETLQQNYQSTVKYLREVQAAKSMNRWTEIGTHTENLKTVLETSEPYLWLAPKIAGDGHEHLSRWTKGVSMLYSLLDNFNKFNVDLQMNKVPALLASGFIAFVSEAVPIFGDVYGKALETIPSLVKWAQNLRDERENTIRQIMGPGH